MKQLKLIQNPLYRPEDVKIKINMFFHKKWQQDLSNNIHNKLFQVKPNKGELKPGFRRSRKEQVTLYQQCICYTRLIHFFLLKSKNQPKCITCQTSYIIKQFLIECKNFAVIRKYFYHINNRRNAFNNISIDNILFFLKEMKLYQKL